MKKFTLVLAAVAVLFTTVGCAKKEAAPKAVADNRPTVRLITDATGIDDKSFNAAAWRGILEFYGDTWENQANRGKKYDVVTCATQDQYVPTLKLASDEGYDLIITTGFTFADALTEVAALYPDQKYMIVDVSWVNLPNVLNFVFKEEQGSYLVGVAAALQSKAEGVANPKFGFIGGVPGATITKFEMGFIQGVHSVLPEAPILDYYANDWGKPDLAKTQAKNWYDSGVYAIFSAAGGTGNGTISQAKEYRIQGKNVWAIGVDSDQYADGLYDGTKSSVLTSMVKRVESASVYALKAVVDGSFEGRVVTLSMNEDGVDYADTNPELDPTVAEELRLVKADIMIGNVEIIPTYAEALKAGVAEPGLGAKDN